MDFSPSIVFRVKLLVWCRCVGKPRGRLRPGSDFAGTRTGPAKPRSLVKLRKFFLSKTLSLLSSQITYLKCTSFTTNCKKPSGTWMILQELPVQAKLCWFIWRLVYILKCILFQCSKFLISSVLFCSWRFFFYLTAFMAGLACLIDVSFRGVL